VACDRLIARTKDIAYDNSSVSGAFEPANDLPMQFSFKTFCDWIRHGLEAASIRPSDD
jgi:hypothetical protein